MAVVIDHTAQTDPRVYNDRPDGAKSIKGILLHHTGSTNEAGDLSWLSSYHDNPVSTHQLIKRDGTIIQIVPNDKRAWHAGLSTWNGVDDCNDWMIGIEICNDGHAENYTPAQYESLAQTIAYNEARYRISDDNVTTHKAVREAWLLKHPATAGYKYDPFGLDLERIWQRVREIRAAWPQGWPPLWYCSGGH